MSDQVIVNDERKPLLYDDRDRPLVSRIGFYLKTKHEDERGPRGKDDDA